MQPNNNKKKAKEEDRLICPTWMTKPSSSPPQPSLHSHLVVAFLLLVLLKSGKAKNRKE
jgi:hypothetical protein